ncbi:MAG TPA: baseplate J/gp47 family protein [Thermoanaerobaculia bacterium]
MTLATPKLDDRGFDDLVGDGRRVIERLCPEWTDRSPNDPGMVLVELFAHLTDVMLYRLNRLPMNAYVEFLRLVGVKLQPPSAASVRLRFTRERGDAPIDIPRGTRVTIARAPAPIFSTAEAVRLDGSSVEVLAYQAELVDGELAGVANGLPGFKVTAKRPPIVAPTGDGLDLLVGVEMGAADDDRDATVIAFDGKRFRIWHEVESFALAGDERHVYVADRLTGTITFAPAARIRQEDALTSAPVELANIPPNGRQVRLWYRRGGGAEGNVVANTLTVMKDAIAGVTVTNLAAASGGRAAETLDNAMIRAPQELYSLERAVTARDFERVVIRSSGAIERARAVTSMDVWRHAQPGTVDVLMVPHVPDELRHGAVTDAVVLQYATDEALLRAQASLDERRPLGTSARAGWVRYKGVRVVARVVIRRGEDPVAIRARLLERLHALITPLPSTANPAGWRFGESLRIGQIYDLLLAEPGVRYADDVRLFVDRAPDADVNQIAPDHFQPRTFYVAAGDTLYRTFDGGDGWESIRTYPNESVTLVEAHPQVPGLVAAITVAPAGESGIHVSRDCGESWPLEVPIALSIDDLEWTRRDGVPLLLLATSKGLYELSMAPGSVPLQVLVEPANQDLGFYAVAATTSPSGAVSVAAAARGMGGVYLSSLGARPGTFRAIGLKGEDIRVLQMQPEGPNALLWAGVAAPGEIGKGCFRFRIWDSPDARSEWEPLARGWDGGSCLALSFIGTKVLAATHRAGVLWLDSARSDSRWNASEVSSGLPVQELTRFEPVSGLAAAPDGQPILAGGPRGIYRASDPEGKYTRVSSPEFTDKVTLPETWLFTSGVHDLDVVVEGRP